MHIRATDQYGCAEPAEADPQRPPAQCPACAAGVASSSRSGTGPLPRHSAIDTPPDVPIRVAPLAIMRSAAAQSRTPPDAFTPSESPTASRINVTA